MSRIHCDYNRVVRRWYAHADTMHGKMFTYAETASDCAATPDFAPSPYAPTSAKYSDAHPKATPHSAASRYSRASSAVAAPYASASSVEPLVFTTSPL
jgi:hypothetical protein